MFINTKIMRSLSNNLLYKNFLLLVIKMDEKVYRFLIKIALIFFVLYLVLMADIYLLCFEQ